MKLMPMMVCGVIICGVTSMKSQLYSEQRKYDWTTELKRSTGETVVKGMLIDSKAISADPAKPAFMAPPPNSQPYYGFPLIDGIEIDGFRFGAITDYLQSDSPAGCTIGDAFVEAPDGTRAGLTWEVGDERKFARIMEPDDRWGAYYFSVPFPVKSKQDMRRNFATILPKLKELYKEARSKIRETTSPVTKS